MTEAAPSGSSKRLGVLISGRGSNLQALIDAVHAGSLETCIAASFRTGLMRPAWNGRGGPASKRCISFLPAFPGLHAQQQALEHGVRISGMTVHLVDGQLDAGPIVLQAAVPVLDDDTEEKLSARTLVEEHRLYPAAVRLSLSGRWRVEGRRFLCSP